MKYKLNFKRKKNHVKNKLETFLKMAEHPQLNERDKKLVWSLDEALRQRKELGKEGDVDLEKDLRIKQVDPAKDILVYEVQIEIKRFLLFNNLIIF